MYEPDPLDVQHDLATESYLTGAVDYRPETNEVWLPRIFLWFGGDFGGRAGILRFLRTYRLLPEGARPTLRYVRYDWALRLDNFG